jgi:hypothetical protein
MKRHSSEMSLDCSICFNEISKGVEYRKNTSNEWFETSVCLDCVMHLKKTQYNDYINQIQTTDCKRTLKRLLDMGPPVWIYDVNIFKDVDYEKNENIIEFKYNDECRSARLDGSVEGDERIALWESLKNLRE